MSMSFSQVTLNPLIQAFVYRDMPGGEVEPENGVDYSILGLEPCRTPASAGLDSGTVWISPHSLQRTRLPALSSLTDSCLPHAQEKRIVMVASLWDT